MNTRSAASKLNANAIGTKNLIVLGAAAKVTAPTPAVVASVAIPPAEVKKSPTFPINCLNNSLADTLSIDNSALKTIEFREHPSVELQI